MARGAARGDKNVRVFSEKRASQQPPDLGLFQAKPDGLLRFPAGLSALALLR
jgi:hypothetical protein